MKTMPIWITTRPGLTRHSLKRIALMGFLLAFVSLPLAGQGMGKRPRVVFDEESTPLQRAMEQTIKNKRNQMRGSSPACEMALQELEELEAREAAGEVIDPKVKERAEKQAAARCKVPRTKKEKFGKDKCPDCGNKMNPAGKVVGKKIVTETILDYDTPDQRGRGQWANVSFPARLLNPLAGQGLAGGGNGVRVRSAALFTDASSNDDKDCIDRVTGGRKGGLDPTTQTPVPDGNPASCFDASGQLKITLQVIPGGCQHTESGATFSGDPSDGFEDDCYDENGALQTTLEELVDEDPSEAGDEDGDGVSGEDRATSTATGTPTMTTTASPTPETSGRAPPASIPPENSSPASSGWSMRTATTPSTRMPTATSTKTQLPRPMPLQPAVPSAAIWSVRKGAT